MTVKSTGTETLACKEIIEDFGGSCRSFLALSFLGLCMVGLMGWTSALVAWLAVWAVTRILQSYYTETLNSEEVEDDVLAEE